MQKDKNLYLQLWGSIMQVGIITLADVCASEHLLSIFQTSVYEHKCLHWLACLSDFYLFVFKFEKSQITVILWILRPKVIEYLMEPGPLPLICFDIYFYYFESWYCFELISFSWFHWKGMLCYCSLFLSGLFILCLYNGMGQFCVLLEIIFFALHPLFVMLICFNEIFSLDISQDYS